MHVAEVSGYLVRKLGGVSPLLICNVVISGMLFDIAREYLERVPLGESP